MNLKPHGENRRENKTPKNASYFLTFNFLIMKTQTKRLMVEVPTEVFQALAEKAKKDRRSVSATHVIILEQWFKAQENEKDN